jgi:hypothetical protein
LHPFTASASTRPSRSQVSYACSRYRRALGELSAADRDDPEAAVAARDERFERETLRLGEPFEPVLPRVLELAAFPREPAEIEERLDLELRIGSVLRLFERLLARSRAMSEPR